MDRTADLLIAEIRRLHDERERDLLDALYAETTKRENAEARVAELEARVEFLERVQIADDDADR